MKALLLRLLPARAAAQIAVVVAGALILANIITAIVLLVALPREFERFPALPYVTELVTIARQIVAAPTPEARRIVTDAALSAQPRLSHLPANAVPNTDEGPWPHRAMMEGLRRDVGETIEVMALNSGNRGPPPLGLRFADGSGLMLTPPAMTPPFRGNGFIFYLLIMLALLACLVGLLSLWAARAVASPLAQLAAAADRFDIDRDDLAWPDHGPVEVRRLAGAFQATAARIRRLVDERTRMLAAVSHDLRTPITRLRLRTEEIGDEDKRRAILADLALMERMVGGALSYLREGRASGSMSATDIPALLQTICDDFVDLGHAVSYEGPSRVSAICDADQMMRAVTNLVDNAIKFGGKAVVKLDAADPARIAIVVEDDGPGIAPEHREKVLEPFYRADLARTLRDDSGFGLGLAIVRAIAEAHRGELDLGERAGGGLVARISWPRQR